MNPIAEILLEQIQSAQSIGQQILASSDLESDRIIYAFATPETLVINCQDYETTWQFDEKQAQLFKAIAKIKSSIKTILVEKSGKTWYQW